MPAIEVQQLTKKFRTYKKKEGFWGGVSGLFRREYQTTEAVSSVSFAIQAGELVGFLGPNGAGKTTVLKILSGLLYPSSGTARVLGFTPWERKNEYRRQFALVMGQKNQLWWDLPAGESFELNREIYGIPYADYKKRLDELLSLLDVRDKLNVMVRELSLGERMKMELIAALLHSPRVLLLDEPTIGLDVVSQKKVRQFIEEYNRVHQVTIILTSHYMADIEALCKRVIVIDRGKIFFDGQLSEIVNRFSSHKILHLVCSNLKDVSTMSPYGEVIEAKDGSIKLKVPRTKVASVCRDLFSKLDIQDVNIEEVPIEEIIQDLFGRASAEVGS
jgi:ABC-2 type transport system ATP-binding protein